MDSLLFSYYEYAAVNIFVQIFLWLTIIGSLEISSNCLAL